MEACKENILKIQGCFLRCASEVSKVPFDLNAELTVLWTHVGVSISNLKRISAELGTPQDSCRAVGKDSNTLHF